MSCIISYDNDSDEYDDEDDDDDDDDDDNNNDIGFDVIQTPAHVQEKLKKAFDKALLDWDNIRNEAIIDVLYTPIPSKFINLLGIDREIHLELLPLHEEWAGDVM